MLDNGGGILNTESEHEDSMETDLLPTVNPRTPGQVPYYNSFPYFAFTPHVIPFGIPLVASQNVPQNIPEHFYNLPRMANSSIAITTPQQAQTTTAYTDTVTSVRKHKTP
jgi:hypothetical protein